MELSRIEKIRKLEVQAKELRNYEDLAQKECELTPQERWDALNVKIAPHLKDQYDPNKQDSLKNTDVMRSTNTIEVSPAEGLMPATYLQISSDPVGPYMRATYSFGEFPDGFGHLPGVRPRLNPVIEPFSPALIRDGFDERLALGLLTAVEQSVEVFCEASQNPAE